MLSVEIRLLRPEDAALLDQVAPEVFDHPVDRADEPSLLFEFPLARRT